MKEAYKLHAQYMIEIVRLKESRGVHLRNNSFSPSSDIAIEINTIKRCADKLVIMFNLKFEG